MEEGDHFAGTAPDAACDGVTTPCTYNNGHVTEVNGDLKRMVATYNAIHGTSATTDFAVHSDMAPNVYIRNNPARGAAIVRTLEKVISDIAVTNPLTGNKENLFVAMADPVEEKTLHMVTADPDRTPTFTPFAQGDYFLNASSSAPCTGNNLDNCVFLPATAPPANTFAWNHGGIQPEIVNVWSGWVGPGVEKKKQIEDVWSDHTDVRPTFLALLGLEDSYVSDGRVLTEFVKDRALAKSLHKHHKELEELGQAWKAINAPLGAFAADTLTASTGALASDTPSDATYSNTETEIENLTNERDALASQIRAALHDAAFNDDKLDKRQAKAWLEQADDLLARASALAGRF